ncbi:MAG: 50S ribosomal protein L31e [archaeon]|jgi:ribosomal protein L31E
MPSESYIIPLKKVYDNKPRTRRANHAITEIFNFMRKHTRMEPKDVIISKEVNEVIWKNSIQNPPRKVAVSIKIDSGKCYVFLKDSKEFKEFGKAPVEKEKKPKLTKEGVTKAVKDAVSGNTEKAKKPKASTQKKMSAKTEKRMAAQQQSE